MKKSKLAIAFLLALLLAFPVFAGGSGETKATAAGTPEDPVEIELWFGAAMTEAGMIPEDWVGYDILRNELGIDLKLTMLPSSEADQDVKIQAAGAGNDLPDLFQVRRPILVNLVNQGLVAQVDDCFDKMPIRTAQQYDADSIRNSTIDGHVYGFASPGMIVRNEGLLIRKDWLDNLGLEIPTTTDELMEVLRAFTFDDPDGNGRNDTYGYGTFIEITASEEGLGRRLDPFFGAFGCAGTWDLSKENPGLNIHKPEYYDAMKYIIEMCNEGVIDPNWLSQKKDDFKAAWKAGKYGIMREQHASYAAESNYAPFDANFPDGEWIVIDPPVGPEGKSAVGVYTNVNGGVVAVSQRAADEGKLPYIAKLLEWMSGPGYYMIGWGEEGVNFILDENGVPITEGLPDPSLGFGQSAAQPLLQLKGLAFYWGEAELQSRYPSYTTAVSGKEMSALTTLREMQQCPWIKQPGVDILPLPSGDLQRFYEQSLAEFASGNRELTPENWAAFIKQFDELGGLAWEEEAIKVAEENNLLY